MASIGITAWGLLAAAGNYVARYAERRGEGRDNWATRWLIAMAILFALSVTVSAIAWMNSPNFTSRPRFWETGGGWNW